LPQEKETILLAEDEPSLRRLIARLLRTQGYTVLEAPMAMKPSPWHRRTALKSSF